jgi:pimeloyl-ACP methyl ester carboxylesterase
MSPRRSSQPARAAIPAQSPATKVVPATLHDHPLQQIAQFSWKTYGYAVLVLCALAVLFGIAVWSRPLSVIETVTRARLLFAGFHGESTTVDGHRIHYLEGGRGKPILLIHGLGGRATDWANLMPQLSKGGYHVYAIDLLGYGESDKPKDADYSIEQETAMASGFLDRLQLAHVDLAGWSMGGWVAIGLALKEPQRVSKLVLCDAAGVTFEPDFTARDLLPQTQAEMQRLYNRLMPYPSVLPSFLARDILRRDKKTQWVVERSTNAMFTGRELMDDGLQRLKMPVLIIWGKRDHLIPVSAALAIHARIPQSTLELYDDCGHLAPGQCADRVGPKMLDFLRGSDQPPAGATVEVPAR